MDADSRIARATGRKGDFSAWKTERVQKVSRYSGQRNFAEVYRYGKRNLELAGHLTRQKASPLLDRVAKYPDFHLNRNVRVLSRAEVVPCPRKKVKTPRGIAPERIDDPWRVMFLSSELEARPWDDGVLVDFTNRVVCSQADVLDLDAGRSFMLDLGLNDCGFPGMTVFVRKPGRLLLTFDEILTEGEVDPARLQCCNVVEWIFETAGTYRIESFEPYVFRYANIFTIDGMMTVDGFYLRTFKNPESRRAKFACPDPEINRIFSAARETFSQNAVDVFTDCPSRERAGWLCDSFFIARVNDVLTGNTDLERLFLENYALPTTFECLPEGMVPMCYPADHYSGRFIPNWAMWLVFEAEEYLMRSGDRAMIDRLRPRILGIVDFLKRYRNSDGLLENLPSWAFVEWSEANSFVQDVNYPSNMAWAEVLSAVGRLYSLPLFLDEAKEVREMVRRQSWTGQWFCDNAVRQTDGTLKLSGECTETCQYYAFYFGTATKERYPELWQKLLNDFGPGRKQTGKHPKIWPSNAFIGNYLRLEILSRAGEFKKVLSEIKGYFSYMADRTGTLWEHDSTWASCNHGFASHVAYVLYRDILGVKKINRRERMVDVRPPQNIGLDWCEGLFPSRDGDLKVRWNAGAIPMVEWGDKR